jgi:L-seryl-tRNA(Ser) seleniumtransferase
MADGQPRVIPSIEQLRQREAVRALEREYGRGAVVESLRAAAETLRQQLARGASEAAVRDADEAAAWLERAAGQRLARLLRPSLQPVINATGVIVHTNLGRAPLAARAAARVAALATGYTNLEYDLARGTRGRRDVHAEGLLCRLTGAEAGVVVNNNAAATLLILTALAAGREVIISRGELVEIGGGFRVPEVMAQSGAILREVGTTNKTRAADYGAAIGERTALILRVHPSNFRIQGFTERPRLEELVALGRRFNVPVVEDLGSGNLLDWPALLGGTRAELRSGDLEAAPASGAAAPLFEEPRPQACLAAGADLVCFSGDKLLGGPQAGIIVGRRDLVERIRHHPLMRAVRVDKMTYAALEATLLEYATDRALETVPVARMIAMPLAEIDRRARQLCDRLRAHPALSTELVDGVSTVGGGSAPGTELPTRLVALSLGHLSADALEARLRALEPPVIARIERDRVVLDLRTVLPDQDALLAETLMHLAEG